MSWEHDFTERRCEILEEENVSLLAENERLHVLLVAYRKGHIQPRRATA